MSQFTLSSDAGPSNYYEADVADNQSYLQSDHPQLSTSNLACSQQTITSAPGTDFLQTPSAPASLRRVGPDRKKSYILYEEMTKEDFIIWWLRTQYTSVEDQKKVRWEGKRSSDVWQHFDQVAHHISGQPKVMCRRCGNILPHPHEHLNGTNSMKRHYASERCLKAANDATKQRNIQQSFQSAAQQAHSSSVFSQETWEREQVKFIAKSHLPFQVLAHEGLQNLVKMAQLAPSQPVLLNPKTARRRLQAMVKEEQQSILSTLPPTAKLSIALDCWTSPFQQAFMAVTGYFIDQDWNYREILLGFEPLHGTHSGRNLSTVLLELLQKHNIANRVLAVTTDNASNNNTLMEDFQKSIDELDLPNQIPIVRIPCLAHVIQLSLRELLGLVKAGPQNDTTEKQWSETQAQLLHVNQHRRGIIFTLSKIRALAVFINASPQRRDAFLGLQTEEPRLVPIQDVKTRWNSTFLMLRRAKRLSSFFDQYCEQHEHPQFELDKEEWRQIDYLLCITEPFYKFTTSLSKTKNVTIHNVFRVYNKHFDHLDASIRMLQRKKVPWKQEMLHALKAGRDKLKFYYIKTDEVPNNLYAIGTILAPQHKLKFFSSKEWGDDAVSRIRYKESFQQYMKPYQRQQPENQSLPRFALQQDGDDLEDILNDDTPLETDKTTSHDELQEYLETSTRNIAPLTFWQENQQQLPTLASMARDVFSIPATGAGVERLFNSARDICHYRRGSLNSTTIQDIMMFRCISSFEIEDEEKLHDMSLTQEEREETNENREARLPEHTPDPISDSEEDDSLSIQAEPTVQTRTQPLSQRASSKRPLSRTLEQDDDVHEAEFDDATQPLPGSSTQIRTSGRHKRPKRGDDMFAYYKP